MEIPLALLLIDNPRLLQKIIRHISTNGIAFEVEIYVHVLSESRGIIVPVGLRITERLQYRVRLYQNILHPEKNINQSLYIIIIL